MEWGVTPLAGSGTRDVDVAFDVDVVTIDAAAAHAAVDVTRAPVHEKRTPCGPGSRCRGISVAFGRCLLTEPIDAPSVAGDEATAHAVAAQLVRHHRISDATYAAAIDAFGETGLVELVTTVGYYCLISVTLNAFEIPLPDDWDDPFPD